MKLAILGMLALTAGCTMASSRMLDNRTAIISGRGTAFTSMAGVADKVLVQAAMEAKARGYPYFVIMESRDASRTGYYTTPTTTNTNVTGTASCMGFMCNGSAQGTSTTYGGQTYGFDKPGADVMVRFLRADEVNPNAPGVWNTDAILAAHPSK